MVSIDQQKIPAGKKNRQEFMSSESHKIDVLFEELLRSYQAELYRFVFSICPNHAAAEDITQETNRVLWEKRNSFEFGTDFRAWMRSIAKFQTLNHLKTLRRKTWMQFDSDLVMILAEDFEHDDEMHLQKRKFLDECVGLIPQSDREMLELKYKNQASLNKISELTNRSVGALKQVFLRIRKQLRDCIQRKIQAENYGS